MRHFAASKTGAYVFQRIIICKQVLLLLAIRSSMPIIKQYLRSLPWLLLCRKHQAISLLVGPDGATVSQLWKYLASIIMFYQCVKQKSKGCCRGKLWNSEKHKHKSNYLEPWPGIPPSVNTFFKENGRQVRIRFCSRQVEKALLVSKAYWNRKQKTRISICKFQQMLTLKALKFPNVLGLNLIAHKYSGRLAELLYLSF